MEITEPRRLYQQLAADLKERIEQGVYLVGDKLPAERFIADEKMSAAPWFVKRLSCSRLRATLKCVKDRGSTSFQTNPNTMSRQMKVWSSPATVRLSCSVLASS